MDKEGWNILCGSAVFDDLVLCARESEKEEQEYTQPLSGFFCWDEQRVEDKKWGIYETAVSTKGIVVAIGSNGDFFEVAPSDANQIDGTMGDGIGPPAHFSAPLFSRLSDSSSSGSRSSGSSIASSSLGSTSSGSSSKSNSLSN